MAHRRIIPVLITLVLTAFVSPRRGETAAGSNEAADEPHDLQTPVEFEVACSPPPVLREGSLCVPVKCLETELGFEVIPVDEDQVLLRYFGTSLYLRRNSSQFTVNLKPASLPIPTFVYQERLYLPVRILESAFGLHCHTSGEAGFTVSVLPSRLTGCRSSVSNERVRMVLDFDRPAPFATEDQQALQLALHFRSVVAASLGGESETSSAALSTPATPLSAPYDSWVFPLKDVLVKEGRVQRSSPFEVSFQAGTRYRAPVKVFTLTEPPRVVVDFVKVFEEVERSAIRPGIEHLSVRRGTSVGPLQIHLAKIALDSGTGRYLLRPALGGETIMQRSAPSEIAKRLGALAATNGGYFGGNGSPLGVLVIDGEWIKTIGLVRTGLIVTHSGKVLIDTVNWSGVAKFGTEGRLDLGMLNTRVGGGDSTRLARNGDVAVFTPRWGKRVTLLSDEAAVVVEESVVTEVINAPAPEIPATMGRSAGIPANGFVLCARNGASAKVGALEEGTRCVLTWKLQSDFGEEIRHVVGAGPRLVRNGVECVTALEEKFQKDVATGRAPRTVVGVTRKNELLLLVADGRRPEESVGLTLQESARIMIDLGAVNALNLDGGSSTTFVIDGKVVNSPSDGIEKRVSNALVLLPG
ncbi:MAG: phosphodiester glycosidase family protein [Armatimonadetes bacterium]|nr:phosphodiester glycosidase family protein [Armatimonadota bacterium]